MHACLRCRVRTATSVAVDRAFDPSSTNVARAPEIEVIDFSRSAERPFGPRFGTLVHATLATVPLDASERGDRGRCRRPGADSADRWPGTLRATRKCTRPSRSSRRCCAIRSSTACRQAERAGRCDRELPIVWKAPDGTLIEGTIDLAFEDLSGLTVVDFKTDRELVNRPRTLHGGS